MSKETHIPLEEELLAENNAQNDSSEVEIEVTPKDSFSKDQEIPGEDSSEPQIKAVPSSEPTPEEQISSLKDQLMRQAAETENLRKRTEREREETARYAVTKIARDMLEISDNLERALEACNASYNANEDSLTEAGKTLLEGVTLTHKTLLSTFERHHVQKVDPKGEKFDHNKHQAMFEVETDEHEPGMVLDVMQPGYVLHDRLLRPAMVGVSKKKSEEKA